MGVAWVKQKSKPILEDISNLLCREWSPYKYTIQEQYKNGDSKASKVGICPSVIGKSQNNHINFYEKLIHLTHINVTVFITYQSEKCTGFDKRGVLEKPKSH